MTRRSVKLGRLLGKAGAVLIAILNLGLGDEK